MANLKCFRSRKKSFRWLSSAGVSTVWVRAKLSGGSTTSGGRIPGMCDDILWEDFVSSRNSRREVSRLVFFPQYFERGMFHPFHQNKYIFHKSGILFLKNVVSYDSKVLTSGNSVEFPAIPTKLVLKSRRKITEFSDNCS